MPVELNHIIVHARDKHAAATFLADILDVPVQPQWGPFLPVGTANGVTLDYVDDDGDFTTQHCAFLVTDDEFDAAHTRLRRRGVQIWADPFQARPGEINHSYGGRDLYFEDPDGHLMEILTQPYGPEPE